MYNLEVEGAGPLVNRLAKFDKAIYSILKREIREATTEVKNFAESLEPASGALFGTMDGERVSAGGPDFL